MSAFDKILIANRGEIAVRVMRTARAMGYRTVAVYSEADRGMPHVAMADEAVAIGPAAARDSYLSIEKLTAAAKRTGADAVHPGYGFLSENATFAEACAAAGLVFIGPPAEAIRLMGNKAAAKRLMLDAGVPCVAGYQGEAQDDSTLLREAERIGFPIMVKAAAGGGGKGMRLVAARERLEESLRAARSEALQAFGSDELILEKAVVEPRHVEIQVFADSHGHTMHLGERDCSVQRRHQKVIEEAPSPAMTVELRREMGEAAVAAARAVGYVGAGTVEFLLAPDARFYFLEMNTRLQVEHPVTEMVTGLDLVEWQLRIAAGEHLPLAQADVPLRGHAIEVRLYAEDPCAGFLPQAGRVVAWEAPERPGVRVDTGIAPGVEVVPHYDPMLAKIIAHGASRDEARRRLTAALRDLVVLGVATNRAFLIDCLTQPDFAAGRFSTAFIDRHFPAASLRRGAPSSLMIALAATLFDARGQGGEPPLAHWRSAGAGASPLRLASGGEPVAVEVSRDRSGARIVAAQGETRRIELVALDGARARFAVDGLQQTAHFAWVRDELHLSLGDAVGVFQDVLLGPRGAAALEGGAAALAPMTGTVIDIRVAAGETVRRGQCLVVLEAMKMQHEIAAPRDGRVAGVLVAKGEQVTTLKVLVELEREAAE